MKIFVTGGLRHDHPDDERAARALGSAIAAAGHTLLQGHYNDFDHAVAEGAMEIATNGGLFEDPKLAVQSFISKGDSPRAGVSWLVRSLPFRDWDPKESGWEMPEPIRSCDVAIVLGGGPLTRRAANLCREAGKPLLPITALGGAASEIFAAEITRFEELYAGRVTRDQYSIVDSQNPGDFKALVTSTVALAQRVSGGTSVFVVMTFREESEDTFSTIKDVIEGAKLRCDRTDQDTTSDRIYQRIVGGIRRAALVVVDVTFTSLNVYYELGFAEALGKQIIVVAKEGTDLPFDITDIPVTFFKNQTRLKAALSSRIAALLGSK